jgi:hypothetical protein
VAEKIELGAGFAYFSVATQDPEVKTGFHIRISTGRNCKTGFRKSKFDTSIHARRTVCS